MICEIREDGREVVLHNPTLLDVLTMLTMLFRRDKEMVFTLDDCIATKEQIAEAWNRRAGEEDKEK